MFNYLIKNKLPISPLKSYISPLFLSIQSFNLNLLLILLKLGSDPNNYFILEGSGIQYILEFSLNSKFFVASTVLFLFGANFSLISSNYSIENQNEFNKISLKIPKITKNPLFDEIIQFKFQIEKLEKNINLFFNIKEELNFQLINKKLLEIRNFYQKISNYLPIIIKLFENIEKERNPLLIQLYNLLNNNLNLNYSNYFIFNGGKEFHNENEIFLISSKLSSLAIIYHEFKNMIANIYDFFDTLFDESLIFVDNCILFLKNLKENINKNNFKNENLDRIGIDSITINLFLESLPQNIDKINKTILIIEENKLKFKEFQFLFTKSLREMSK